MSRRSAPVGVPLVVLREATLASLLTGVAPQLRRLEASGVTYAEGLLWIVFDNLPHVVAVDPALQPGPLHSRLLAQPGPAAGYEDVAWDDRARQGFALIESARAPDGGFRPQIDEFDAGWTLLARRWVDLVVDRPNKGLEGLVCAHRNGDRYLLALAERGSRESGRREGGGRGHGRRGHGRRERGRSRGVVHVLARGGEQWVVHDRIALPADLPFPDFSALSLHGDRMVVVSQEASALWVGQLDRERWRVTGPGHVYSFPTDRRGRRVYGTVEGVCWLDDDTIAAVSDRAKRRQPHRFRRTDESVHIVALPPRRS